MASEGADVQVVPSVPGAHRFDTPLLQQDASSTRQDTLNIKDASQGTVFFQSWHSLHKEPSLHIPGGRSIPRSTMAAMARCNKLVACCPQNT
ncbi:hypothetical protein KC340_g7 [Hortaea werneckii]|nr:hypothetical protein KC340_g7 [Hortaea werneckii]